MNQMQIKALDALMTTRNLSEAAKQAGISRKTLYHYIHNDYEFATAYREMMNGQLAQTMDDLQQRREAALSVITDIMNNPNEKTENRLRAAQIIVTESNKAAENAQKAAISLEGELGEAETAREHAEFIADIYAPITAEEKEAIAKENPIIYQDNRTWHS